MSSEREREFQAFLTERHGSLSRLARLTAPGRDQAEDVLQTAMLQLWRSWDKVRTADDPDAYTRRIVINTALSLSRRRWLRERPLADLPDDAPLWHGPGARPVTEQLHDRDELVRVLARLPPRQRVAVVLRYFADLDDAAVAVAMSCSVQTVRSQISRALRTLRVEQSTLTREVS